MSIFSRTAVSEAEAMAAMELDQNTRKEVADILAKQKDEYIDNLHYVACSIRNQFAELGYSEEIIADMLMQYLYKNKKVYWITAIPATFMTAVSVTYLFYAKECLNLGTKVAYPIGILAAALCLALFLSKTLFHHKKEVLG